MDFDLFLQKVMLLGLEYFNLFYGVYRGQVLDTKDPEDRGRVRVTVPGAGVMEASDLWIPPVGLFGAGVNRGMFWPPELGDSVWVAFAQGKSRYPLCYWPGWYGTKDEVPSELRPATDHSPKKRGFVTRRGHRLIFNETAGEDAVELIWHKPSSDPNVRDTPARTGQTASVKLNASGGIELKDRVGNRVTLDPAGSLIEVKDQTGNSLKMSAAGVVIDCGTRTFEVNATAVKLNATTVDLGNGAAHPVAQGDSWVAWAASHTHGTGVGVSTPPIAPPTPALNSVTVRTKT